MQEDDSPLSGAMIQSINQIAADIYSGIKASTAAKSAEIKNAAALGFKRLLEETYERRGKIKTIIDPDVSIKLRDIYVPCHLAHNGSSVSEGQFFKSLREPGGQRAVILGTAGAGKSLLLKNLLLEVADNWHQPIPIFVELRTLNDVAPGPDALRNLILQNLTAHVRDFSAARLDDALFSGKFMLLLDALDEVDQAHREQACHEIVRLSERNRRCTIVVSSRPDSIFKSWEDFGVFTMQGLSKSASAALVSKLPYPRIADIKAKFLAEVIERDFKKHREFLSVPLLLAMMLLVYRNFSEVPDKIINFYKRAFETLFYGHDAMKGATGFKRPLRSGLALEDFVRTFAAFCVATYRAGKTNFEVPLAQSVAEKAIKNAGVDCTADEFLADLQQAVCVLQQDGIELTFVHRSFQEYFAASYLVRVSWSEGQRRELLLSLAQRFRTDGISGMMLELDPGVFEREWLLPTIDHVIEQVERTQSAVPDAPVSLAVFVTCVDHVYWGYRNEVSTTSGLQHTNVGFLWDFVATASRRFANRVPEMFSSFTDRVGDSSKTDLHPFLRPPSDTPESMTRIYRMNPTMSEPYIKLFSAISSTPVIADAFPSLLLLRDEVRSRLNERAKNENDLLG